MKKNNIFLYALENKVVFPYHEYTFSINSNLYNPELYDNLIGFITKIDETVKDVKGIEKIGEYTKYGVLLKIHKSDIAGGYKIFQKTKIFTVNYAGLTFARFKVMSLTKVDNKLIGNIQIFSDQITKEVENNLARKGLVSNFKNQMKTYYEIKMKYNESDMKKQLLENQKSINKMLYKSIDEIDIHFLLKLKFLQIDKHEEKFEFLISNLIKKTQNMKNVIDIQDKVRQDMFKSSAAKRKTVTTGRHGDQSDIQQKINNKKLPENVREEINKEMKRMGGESQAAVTLKYIETLLEIPWLQSTEDVKDISLAEKILNEDHTGLKEVKERILEFLAVRFRNGNSKGNIICLHGPPGVGKTSIAKSIAKALGRQFTRVSLGGMNDQAQLRGHRRTYVAALPGVIIRALIKSKSNNPVILLDQIQKMGQSYKGNPEHALLEILDPSQNSSFVDHYVSIPVDLSKVMFICTANSLQLSAPLMNRLELIEVPGYTREQKLQIAKNHLLPLQIRENGVEGLIQFEDDGLKEIIKYSNELGVRQLERKISKICRKVARKGQREKVTKEVVQESLGKRYKPEFWGGIGVVNGMAWTQMGGKLLTVEAIQYQSKRQKIEITGQLGDVMKESANIAFSWIKANLDEFSIVGGVGQALSNSQKADFLDRISLHLHFPEGATKKDGPSAGVTIVACISSLLLKAPVRQNLSMTGEITLSGKVLPVGGIRQKCIAAIYEGIKHIIIPYGNLKDVDKIDADLRKQVQFYPVKDLKQVLSVAFPGLIQKPTPKL